jgi:VWFA-related protein
MRHSFQLFRSALAALALTAALPALPAVAQQPPAAQPPPAAPLFGETIEVRVVNVEVVVTDRDGHRVQGLTPKDFRLRVDGQPVAIDFFSEVRGGDVIAPEPGQPAVQGLPSLAPGEPVGTSYLVFIDDYFSLQNQRDGVLRKLKDDLPRVGPEDRMAIVAYDGKKLDMLSSWTGSGRELGRAIDIAMGRPAAGLQRVAELRSFDTSRRLSGNSFNNFRRNALETRLDVEELAYAQRLADQVERTVNAAVSTLRGFASPPGRKVMLVLSGGWPFSPAEYAVNAHRPIIERELPSGEELFQPLTEAANLLGYTLYSVDVPGLQFEGPDAEQQNPTVTGLPIRELEVHEALQYVADRTGGRALLNGLRSSALEAAAEDTRAYYWLGFTPQRKRDDARHKVEVEVLRPGLKARARGSFLDQSRGGEVTMMVESAMLFGSSPGSEPLPVQLGVPERSGRGEMMVPLSVAIPTTAITTVAQGGKHEAELELRVAAVDENGNRSQVPVIPLRLSFPQQPEAGQYVPYETKLRLRRAGHHLVVAVYDPLSGIILTGEADVRAAGKSPAGKSRGKEQG